jgi:alanine racemase
MTRPIRATIDLAALRHNLSVARQHAQGARIWAVLKANAYGHGLLRCAQTLAAASPAVDGFALIELESAIRLREAGLQQPLLLLEGFYSPDELPLFAEYRLTPTLHSLSQVKTFVSTPLTAPLPVYLKLNTGMNRLGLNADELPVALQLLHACKAGITLMTHFADADSLPDKPGVTEQMHTLDGLLKTIDPANWSGNLCLANSAALLRYPETTCAAQQGWVRPGLMLYGCSPFPQQQSAASLGLHPVMTLRSELIAVRRIAAGERVGYGGAFVAARDMRIGIVACGYADGYPRHASTGTPVLVDGQRTRLLGRVSMDKLCVDLEPTPLAEVGTPVTLWGEGLCADEVATAAGTISYELLCALTTRIPIVEIA